MKHLAKVAIRVLGIPPTAAGKQEVCNSAVFVTHMGHLDKMHSLSALLLSSVYLQCRWGTQLVCVEACVE